MWRAVLVWLAVFAMQVSQARGGRAKYHMREQLEHLRTIEELLVAGKLDDAKALAFMVKPVVQLDSREAHDLTRAVTALRQASSLDAAIYAEAQIATACAGCHLRAKKLPRFRTPSHAPADRPTLESQMSRHQWAVDRVWEGLIAQSNEHWRAGLYVLATSSLPRTTTHAPAIAKRLQQQARAALDNAKLSPTERADAYAEILVTCSSCHAAAR